MAEHAKYRCPKCNNRQYEEGAIHVTGGFWSKIFDIQGKRFTTITCSYCGFTELYKGSNSSTGGNIFDLLTN